MGTCLHFVSLKKAACIEKRLLICQKSSIPAALKSQAVLPMFFPSALQNSSLSSYLQNTRKGGILLSSTGKFPTQYSKLADCWISGRSMDIFLYVQHFQRDKT